MSLSRQDVVLGRALISWGLVQQRVVEDCVEDVKRVALQGRTTTLGEMLVMRGFLSVDRYHAIVARLHEESASASPQVQSATAQVPFMSKTGSYTQTFPRPMNIEESTIDRAVESWTRNATDVTASGSQIGKKNEASKKPPIDDKRRPDRPIRKRLKVPAGVERYPIGNWMIEEFIAAGNWGIVYRVTQKGGDGRSFALKILKLLDPSQEVRQRFIQEARTMARLTHPGIVKVYDAGVISEMLWFVMDYLEGPNLKEVFDDSGALSLKESLRVLKRLCSAVSYAHSESILHRDLKPDNVIMADGTRPVLTDFGLAKDVGSSLNLTQEGQRIGTPLYMAPELLLDSDKANARSEVYSLGAILYQCLTGKVPFQAKSMFELVDKIEEGKMPSLSKACPKAPKKLEKLIKRVLHKDPAKRPATVKELAAEIAAIR